MLCAQRTFFSGGKKRKRHTQYRYVNVREHDWYNIHRLANKFRLSIADTVALLVTTNLEAFDMEPLTAQGLANLGENPVDS